MTETKKRYQKPALDKAMDFLARRDHSEKELRQKLKLRDYSPTDIDRAIGILKERNHLLPPEELAIRMAHFLHNRGKGAKYIQMYLQKRGLPSLPTDIDHEISKGLELIEKKLGFQPPFSRDVLAKIQRFLQNRGYDFESIKRIINHE